MQDIGVISKVEQPTEWCSGMVAVPKANTDQIRICMDLTKLNESVTREKHPLPTVEASLSKLAGGRYFSKLDANRVFGKSVWLQNHDFLTRLLRPLVDFGSTACLSVFPLQVSTFKRKCPFC